MTTENEDFLANYKRPQELFDDLWLAAGQVMGLQLEIYDALKYHVGYSWAERLKLKWLKRKYARLANRIYKAMSDIPEFKVPERHPLIERALQDAQPTDLKGALDELATMENGECLIVGPLSRGQKAAVYGRAKKRGFEVEVSRALHSDVQLKRVRSYEG